MIEYVPDRENGELLAIEVKLAPKMPYRQVVSLMRKFLAVRSTLKYVTVRNRALRWVHASRQGSS
jgi:hypothetical protein